MPVGAKPVKAEICQSVAQQEAKAVGCGKNTQSLAVIRLPEQVTGHQGQQNRLQGQLLRFGGHRSASSGHALPQAP